MAAITWGTSASPPNGDVVRRVPAMVSVDAGVQADILAFVNTALDVRLFELGEADPRLKLARVYLALHFATGDASNGVGDGSSNPAGPVTQEQVGEMMVQYGMLAGEDPLLGTTYWGRQYLTLMRPKKFGMLVV